MIKSFADKETEALFDDRPGRRFRAIERASRRKLEMLDAAERLDDLRQVPGNRLEKLIGARAGQHSIRINERWRVCFAWRERGAFDVEIVDYH